MCVSNNRGFLLSWFGFQDLHRYLVSGTIHVLRVCNFTFSIAFVSLIFLQNVTSLCRIKSPETVLHFTQDRANRSHVDTIIRNDDGLK